MKNPLEVRKEGLYCKPGEFYIDAWAAVDTCLVTHAHGDHARYGHKHYIAQTDTCDIMKLRLGNNISTNALPYEKKIKIGNCWVSLHSAGHILGSAQIRIEADSTVCVVSGDYKRAADPTCDPFEIVECDIFVTESTFALPIYKWENSETIALKILAWWKENQAKGFASVLFGYALGKAQRILSLLSKHTDQQIYVHGAISNINEIYQSKQRLVDNYLPIAAHPTQNFSDALIMAPPLVQGSPWMKRFYPYRTALASGWMQVRGTRRRKNLDRGFSLSDHADWPDLLQTIQDTKAELILSTHGNSAILARYLQEKNIKAYPLAGTEWMEEGEGEI